MIEPRRQRAAAAGAQIEIEHLGLHLARRALQRGQKRGAIAPDQVGEFQAAGADLGQILVEPVGQRLVEIDDIALGIDGEKAGRRVIEIVDGVLQRLKGIFLLVAVARHVGERPHRQACLAAAIAERADLEAQPARRPAADAGDPYHFLGARAFAGRLEQPVDRLGGVGVADEHALDRPHVVQVRRLDQVEIGGIGIDHAAVRVGDDDAIEGAVDHRLDQRADGAGRGQPQDAAGEREQREHADGGKHREEGQDIGLGIAAAEHDDGGCGGDQHAGDQQHQHDAAAAFGRRAAVDRLAREIGLDRLPAPADRVLCRHSPPRNSGSLSVPSPAESRKGICTMPRN